MPTPTLGLSDHTLLCCGTRPNCVCSDDHRPRYWIPPLQLIGRGDSSWQYLRNVLAEQSNICVVTETDCYLRAEATSRVFRFIDDIEFHLRPQTQEIAMRSSSRVGYFDFRVNRQRLETLRAVLAAAGIAAPPTH